MKEASGDARKATAFTMSPGTPRRFSEGEVIGLPDRFGRWWIALTRWGNSNRTGDSGPMAGSRASIRVVHNRTVLGLATKMRKSLPPFR
jgi:hypothetical protein